jgi:hypothetical protein
MDNKGEGFDTENVEAIEAVDGGGAVVGGPAIAAGFVGEDEDDGVDDFEDDGGLVDGDGEEVDTVVVGFEFTEGLEDVDLEYAGDLEVAADVEDTDGPLDSVVGVDGTDDFEITEGLEDFGREVDGELFRETTEICAAESPFTFEDSLRDLLSCCGDTFPGRVVLIGVDDETIGGALELLGDITGEREPFGGAVEDEDDDAADCVLTGDSVNPSTSWRSLSRALITSFSDSASNKFTVAALSSDVCFAVEMSLSTLLSSLSDTLTAATLCCCVTAND